MEQRLRSGLISCFAITNLELLKVLPWRERAFDSLPSRAILVLTFFNTFFEDIPQLTIQLLFTHRTTGIQNFHELDWQLKLSIGLGSASLLFRVLLRCFIALEKKCHQEQPQLHQNRSQVPLLHHRPLCLGHLDCTKLDTPE